MISFDSCDTIVIKQICFQSVLRPELEFSYSSRLKSVLEKLRSRDGLVWTCRPNRRNKAVFSHEFFQRSMHGYVFSFRQQ